VRSLMRSDNFVSSHGCCTHSARAQDRNHNGTPTLEQLLASATKPVSEMPNSCYCSSSFFVLRGRELIAMAKTIVRKQSDWAFYWVVITDDSRMIAQSSNTYATSEEAFTMARGNVQIGEDVIDETSVAIPRPSQSSTHPTMG
jgi:hypothetical protein